MHKVGSGLAMTRAVRHKSPCCGACVRAVVRPRNPHTRPHFGIRAEPLRADSGKLSGHARRFTPVDRSRTCFSETPAATPVMMPCTTVQAPTEPVLSDLASRRPSR